MDVVYILRKPLNGIVVESLLGEETGAINIDECRLETKSPFVLSYTGGNTERNSMAGPMGHVPYSGEKGRFPTNLILIHLPECSDTTCIGECPCAMLDLQGDLMGSHSAGKARKKDITSEYAASSYNLSGTRQVDRYGDEGGVSRFFYQIRVGQ
jgi:hypothetical protein